ncbi:MAG: hypothetical protein R6U57_06650 [Anaerolineales bacterium]
MPDSAFEGSPTPSLETSNDLNPTPEATVEETSGTVVVEVINRANGGDVEGDLQVRLEGYDHMTRVYHQTLPLEKGGRVTFAPVPFKPGRYYFASLDYQGAIYRSDIVELEPDLSSLDLSVEIFGTTTDQAALSMERVHIFVNFSQTDVVQFGEIFTVSNFGEKTVVAEERGGPVLVYPLPEGAQNLRFESGSLGERYILTEEGFGDTLSIPPGSGVYQMLVFFDMPYENQGLEFEQKMNLPVGAVVVITPAGGVELKASSLKDMGVREVQDGSIHVYSREQLCKGDKIAFSLSGLPGQPGIENGAVSEVDRRHVIIGIGVFGIVLLWVGRWMYGRWKRGDALGASVPDETIGKEEIVDTIIALDDLYASGEIREDAYRTRRSALKSQLRDLMESEG